MSLLSGFKRAKVARRILALFLFGALLPIGVLAIVSFSRMVDRLNALRGSDLQIASEQVRHDVEDRIDELAQDLAATTSGFDDVVRSRAQVAAAVAELGASDVVRGIAILGGDGATFPLVDSLAHAVSGPPDAVGPAVIPMPGPPPSVMVIVPADGNGNSLVLDLLPRVLFGNAITALGDRVDEVCVVDADWAPVRCSAPPDPAAVTAFGATDGSTHATWLQDEIPRLGGFAASDAGWGVVTMANASTLVTAVGDFGQVFLIVIIVVVLAVFLFSHFQIKKSLRPLKLLQDATAKVADRRFAEPVIVTSGDEFEELARSFNVMADQVESQFRALTAMNEIGRSVLSTAKTNEIIDTVLDRAPNIASCDAVVFALRENKTDETGAPMGGWNVQGRPVGGAQTITATVAPTKAEIEELWNCATQISIDLNESPRSYVDLVELVKRGVIYFVVFPLQLENQVAGAIAMGFTEKPDVQGDNIIRGKRLVDQVTVALRNSELITELNKLNFGTIAALARTIDASSPWTAGHSTRVTKMALDIAKELRLPPAKIDILHRGGLLHDIGKIGTPPTILNKPGRLDPDELKIMQDHTVVGAKILAPIPQYAEIIPIVRHHHERIDGKGYPDGIGGDEIPFLARVLAVADIFDALISDRPYRAGWPEERVVGEIQKMSGTHLDPQVVEAFLTVKAPTLNVTRKSIPYLSVEVDDFYTWID